MASKRAKRPPAPETAPQRTVPPADNPPASPPNVLTGITRQQKQMQDAQQGTVAQTESAQADAQQRALAEAASGRSYQLPEYMARETTQTPDVVSKMASQIPQHDPLNRPTQMPLGDPNSIADQAHMGTIIPPERIRRYKMMRVNPIRALTAQYLVQQLDNWYLGYLRQTVMMWDAMRRRDDTLSTVIGKRLAAVGRKDWDVTIPEEYKDDPEAQAQKDALNYFYQNLRVTHAVEQNMLGGVALMAKQMVEAQGFYYTPHEILWRQTDSGVTAVLNCVPLWFFENRTGRLRFLPYDTSWDGDPLDDGAWMVTVGLGLMEACSILYYIKQGGFKDWANYSELHGTPGQVAVTDSIPGSAPWVALENTLETLGPGFKAVINMKDKLDKIDWTCQGELPMPPLVERCDRGIAQLWMGGDLSTLSGKAGGEQTGASLQGQAMDIFEQDDCQLVTDTCNMQLDPMILKIVFGEDMIQKAWFSYGGAINKDMKTQIAVDTALQGMGFPLSQGELAEYYERTPATGDDVLTKPQPTPAPGMGGGMGGGYGGGGSWADNERRRGSRQFTHLLGNEAVDQRQLIASAMQQMAKQQSIVLNPLKARMKALADMGNEQEFIAAVKKLKADLPDLLKQINKSPVTAKVLETTLTAALLNGMQAPRAKLANEGTSEGAAKGWETRRGVTHSNSLLLAADGMETSEAAKAMPATNKKEAEAAWKAHQDAFRKQVKTVTSYRAEGNNVTADYYADRAKEHLAAMHHLTRTFGVGKSEK